MHRLVSLVAGLSLLLAAPAAWSQETVSSSGDVLLVAHKTGNSLFIVDASSYAVLDTASTGQNPHEVAAAPSTGRAYVANYGGGTISVIDIEAGREIDRWPLPGIRRPHGIQVGPNDERVYVTAETQRAVVEVDAASGSALRKFETGKETTHMLALTPSADRLVATSIGSGTASVIDLRTGRVTSHVETGEGAEGVACRSGDVWVTNRADDTVSVLDIEMEAVVDTLRVPGFPIRVAFGRHGRRAIVSAPRAGEVAIIDAPNRRVLSRLEVGAKPIGVVTDGARRAFVASMGADVVSVVDLDTRTVSKTLDVGSGPDGMAYVAPEE